MARAKKQEPEVPEKILVDNPDCEVATKGYVKRLSRSVLKHRHPDTNGSFSCVLLVLAIVGGVAMMIGRMTPPPELVSVVWTVIIVSGINTLDALFAEDNAHGEANRVGNSWSMPDLEDATPKPVKVEFKTGDC